MKVIRKKRKSDEREKEREKHFFSYAAKTKEGDLSTLLLLVNFPSWVLQGFFISGKHTHTQKSKYENGAQTMNV